ncbi:hypothetical protein F5Y11DRAFT_134775 [Daldinia sp. FL1419]|nr:hypothetical protein F5Y11DRAFT_134775 [Daldinia sp. FL1419]
MAGSLLSLVGWTFLPNLVTGWIQSIYYGFTIRAGDPKPAPNSPQYAEHRRRIHILVVSLYLLYTIYEADYEIRQDSNYYVDLGVPLSASERDIRSRFRRLAALHHPDKVMGGNEADNNDFFMRLKTASETLMNPARRFAYERFGPEILDWNRCVTIRDYIVRGGQALIPYYVFAAVGMYLLGLLGYLEWGRYWRWLTLVVMFVFELHTISRPYFPAFLGGLVNPFLARFTDHPPYLPFQIISLARKLCVTLYIGFSQIGPLLQPANRRGLKPSEEADKALQQSLLRLEQTAQSMDADAARLMELDMAPFVGDAEAIGSMRGKLREWLIQNTIRADPMVKDALGRSFQRRRTDAPPGAKGTR